MDYIRVTQDQKMTNSKKKTQAKMGMGAAA